MRKIILTTFFKAENYGAALQVYALQSVLQHKGFCVEILNYRDANIEGAYRLIKWKQSSFHMFLRACASSILFYKRNWERHKKFIRFQESYLQIGETEYWNVRSIKENFPEAECYITGSDQVWNTEITKEVSDVYTLNFGPEHIQRISYAASIGNSQISREETRLFREKLSRINVLSVRETTAKITLEKLGLEKSVSVTLDPVFLRSKEEWETEIMDIEKITDKYILAYYVEPDEEYQRVVSELSRRTGLKVIHFERWRRYSNELFSAYTAGPFEFVNLIRNAEYIITTSFHATAFSIIFHKEFWAFPHRHTGSRVEDLLSTLKISDRVIHTYEEFLLKRYDQQIDYVKVDFILDREKDKSLKWLEVALENRRNMEE